MLQYGYDERTEILKKEVDPMTPKIQMKTPLVEMEDVYKRQHPYPFQSDGDRDRTAFQYGSKSAEHPYPDGSRQANAPDVCTRQRV